MCYLHKECVVELEHIVEINNRITSVYLQELEENLQVYDYINSRYMCT